jgi:hypothetical protein
MRTECDDKRIMAVDIKSTDSVKTNFQFGVPRPLFEVRIAANSYTDLAVSKDGRFLLPRWSNRRLQRP